MGQVSKAAVGTALVSHSSRRELNCQLHGFSPCLGVNAGLLGHILTHLLPVGLELVEDKAKL